MKKRRIEFYEQQQMNQWWRWALLGAVNIMFIYGIVQQIIFNRAFGSNPMSNVGLIITSCIVLALTIILFRAKLKTFINNEGIYVSYFPFMLRTKYYEWSDIEKAYIRTYSAVKEFGGWGVRTSFKKKGFVLSGNTGLQLELKNGRKVLIGTRQPEEIAKILEKKEE